MQKKVKSVLLADKNGKVISLKDSKGTLPALQTPPKEGTTESNWKQANHLYIVDEEAIIKKGDWFVLGNWVVKATTHQGSVCYIPPINGKQQNSGITYSINKDCKKIIASTDSSLGLPGISQSFLEQFVAVQGKGYVMMEMTKCFECTNKEKCIYVENDLCERLLHPKLDENGCVVLTIDSSKWDKLNERFDKALDKAEQSGYFKPQTVEDAAKEFLTKVKSPALNTSWEQFDIDIFKAGAEWQKERSFDLMTWANLNNYTLSSEGWIQDTDSQPISDNELYNRWLYHTKQ